MAGLEAKGTRTDLYAPASFSIEPLPYLPDPKSLRMFNVDIRAKTELRADIRAIRHLSNELNQNGLPSIIHSHGYRAGLVGCYAAKKINLPAIVTAHNLPPTGKLQRIILAMVLKRCTCVVAVSQAIAHELKSIVPFNTSIRVIPNGIHLESYMYTVAIDRKALVIAPNDFVVMYVGRLSPEKGVPNLMTAFNKFSKDVPDCILLIVGEGPSRPELERQSSGSSRVRFLGTRTDIPGLLACSDVVVVPSLAEGQGLVALEAMASARAVIASAVGGLCESIKDGETGILVTPGDPNEIVTQLTALYRDADKRRLIGAMAQQHAAANFSLERMIGATSQLYTKSVLDCI